MKMELKYLDKVECFIIPKGPIPKDGIKKLMADKLALMQLKQELKKENTKSHH